MRICCGKCFRAKPKERQEAPRPAGSASDELLTQWNSVHSKLVAMAKDFPEDQYDFKVQKDERTFAENLLHVAGVDYIFMNAISGHERWGRISASDPENPSRTVFKTKADVVKLMEQASADGAAVIKQLGDAGLNKEFKYPFGNIMAHGFLFHVGATWNTAASILASWWCITARRIW